MYFRQGDVSNRWPDAETSSSPTVSPLWPHRSWNSCRHSVVERGRRGFHRVLLKTHPTRRSRPLSGVGLEVGRVGHHQRYQPSRQSPDVRESPAVVGGVSGLEGGLGMGGARVISWPITGGCHHQDLGEFVVMTRRWRDDEDVCPLVVGRIRYVMDRRFGTGRGCAFVRGASDLV